MAYFSIPRASCIGEYSLDATANDTNDGTKTNGTATNLTYANTQVGYQKQHAVFGATSSFTRASLASIQTLAVAVYPTAASKTLFTYVTSTGLVTFNGSYVVSTTGLTNATIYVNGVQASTLTANAWNLLIITHDSATATNFNLGSSSFLGNACMLRTFNAKLTEVERLQLWHEFNRKLGGGSDFGAYIPAPLIDLDFNGDQSDLASQIANTSSNVTYGQSDYFGLGRCATFNGSNSYVQTGNVVVPSAFTMVCMFRRDNGNDQSYYTGGGYPNGPMLFYSAGSFVYRGSGGTNPLTYGSLSTGWHTCVVSQNGTSGTMYVDGVQQATGTVNSGAGTIGFEIGRLTASLYWLSGAMQRFQILGTNVDANQAKFIHNQLVTRYPYAFRRSIPSSLSNGLLFRCGAFNGSTMYDESGNGNNFTGTATKVRSGQLDAGSFSSQLLTLTRSAALENANGSVACWFKTSSRANAGVIIENNNVINSDRYGILIYRDTSGFVNFEVANASAYYRATTAVAFDDGKWHRAVGTWDGSTIKLYIDGALMASAAQGAAIAYNAQDFKIGGDTTNATRYFAGSLAYPTLWNRVLNTYEVMMDRYSIYTQ